jgi:hypothetical protein
MSNLNAGVRRCRAATGYRILSGVQEAGRDGLGQFVGPGIAAEIKSTVAEAGVGLLGQKVDARKTALREFISTGYGYAVQSGAKFVEVDHLAVSNYGVAFKRLFSADASFTMKIYRQGRFANRPHKEFNSGCE